MTTHNYNPPLEFEKRTFWVTNRNGYLALHGYISQQYNLLLFSTKSWENCVIKNVPAARAQKIMK